MKLINTIVNKRNQEGIYDIKFCLCKIQNTKLVQGVAGYHWKGCQGCWGADSIPGASYVGGKIN